MESWGCQVRTAEDGRQAMQVAQSWVRPPDIVISDLKLGDGRSGLDVLNALARHYGSASHPPFARLLITGETKRSEEHTSELQSLMRISYAVLCLKKKINNRKQNTQRNT